MSIVLGFTGTREQLSEKQFFYLVKAIRSARELHHGACVGADKTACDAAFAWGVPSIVIHPPIDERLMMDLQPWRPLPEVRIMPAKDYHARNRDIVDASDRLLALPHKPEDKGGGTWYTVHYAERQGVPVFICHHDGNVEMR